MEKEEQIRQFASGFGLTVNQLDAGHDRGYRLRLSASWPTNWDVRSISVQLTGINPLSGKDVEKDAVIAKFSFEKKKIETDVLTYHGRFILRCSATLPDGRQVVFREQEINLVCKKNTPYIDYRISCQNGFAAVELTSNCWDNYRGKVWLHFDSHNQRIDLPMGSDRRLRFVVPAVSKPEIKVQDDFVILRNGR